MTIETCRKSPSQMYIEMVNLKPTQLTNMKEAYIVKNSYMTNRNCKQILFFYMF